MSTPTWQHFEDDTLILELRVQPRASRDEVVGVQGGRLKVRIAAAPVDNAANSRLKGFLAKEFGVTRGRIRLLSGEARREKRVAVDGPRRLPSWFSGGSGFLAE